MTFGLWQAILIAVVIVVPIVLIKWLKKKHQPVKSPIDSGEGDKNIVGAGNTTADEEQINDLLKKGTVTARVADNITGRIYNAQVTKDTLSKIIKKHGTLGRQWDRDGKKIYGFNRYQDEKTLDIGYRPIIPSAEMNNAPTDLFNDMQQPEIPILMDMREEKSFIQKYGTILWWVAVMAFIMFLWASNK